MPSARERGGEPGVKHGDPLAIVEKPAGKAKNVGVVVFGREPGHRRVPDDGRADSMDFVGRDRHPDARAAEQDPPAAFFPGHLLGHETGVIRVVDGIRRGRPHVHHAIPQTAEMKDDLLLAGETSVVGPDGDLQAEAFLKFTRRMKSSALRLAPPTKPPSMSGWDMSVSTLSGLTLPP